MLPSLFTSPANSAGGLAQVGVRDEEILEVHHAASIEIRIDLHGGINGCARKRGVDSQGLQGMTTKCTTTAAPGVRGTSRSATPWTGAVSRTSYVPCCRPVNW